MRQRIGDEAQKTIVQERQWSQTRRKLQELYVLAIKNFHADSIHSLTQKKIGEKSEKDPQNASEKKSMPAEMFYSHKVQNWIQACEHINGLQMMLGMREWKAASRFGYRAIRIAPFEHLV